jgi:predicted AlkP superfamily pyrophosphatase or phosphodiesterase
MSRWIGPLLALLLIARIDGAEPRSDRCVVLISVDGLANFYLDDPQADLPTIRQLAEDGAQVNGLVASFPTVTWPNHTTLVTGTPPALHGVLGNNYLDRDSGTKIALIPDPLFDKDQIVQVPTIYDAAHDAGLATAGIIWPATRNARTLDWTVPDMAGDEAWSTYGTPGWLEELRSAQIPIERHGAWCRDSGGGGVMRDWLYTRLAKQLFETHPPNLMLIHLIEVDHVQHKYGPRTPEAYWSVRFADDRVRDIVEAARESEFGENVTIIVASDHGFFPIERDIRPNIALRELGLIGEAEGGSRKRAYCVAQGGGCMVYVLDEERRSEIAEQLTSELAKIEGVQAVIGPDRFAELGLAQQEEDTRAPDLWLAAKSGYSFTDTEEGDGVVVPRATPGGTHGYLPDQPDMLATLVLSGAGVRRGVTVEKSSNQDVAPTIARLLGIEFPTATGQVLEDALE